MNNSKAILIVDDIFTNRFSISLVAKKFGLISFLAADGSEALNHLNNSKIDLVLLDIEMPGMNGYETLKQIRSSKNITHRSIPIVAISAHSDEEIIKNAAPHKFDIIINKPITMEILGNIIEKFSI